VDAVSGIMARLEQANKQAGKGGGASGMLVGAPLKSGLRLALPVKSPF
jgi:hypothetical protein